MWMNLLNAGCKMHFITAQHIRRQRHTFQKQICTVCCVCAVFTKLSMTDAVCVCCVETRVENHTYTTHSNERKRNECARTQSDTQQKITTKKWYYMHVVYLAIVFAKCITAVWLKIFENVGCCLWHMHDCVIFCCATHKIYECFETILASNIPRSSLLFLLWLSLARFLFLSRQPFVSVCVCLFALCFVLLNA